MEDALWVTSRHGGIDPLDPATTLIGFSRVHFGANVCRLLGSGEVAQQQSAPKGPIEQDDGSARDYPPLPSITHPNHPPCCLSHS